MPLDAITPSPLNPRREFGKTELAELAASIRENGVLQPILVRPSAEPGRYELVAGERRWRASHLAELAEIPAVIREIPDDQVRTLALLENLQRKDLHPIEEADGLAALHHDGMAVSDIAAKIGKHINYVYGRIKLADLSPKARKLYRAGHISHAAALLVARLPSNEDRDTAAKYIAERSDGEDPMGTYELRHYLDSNFLLKLAGASFPKDIADYVAGTPACTTCPKRTGNQRALFADVKDADTCTDPTCFAQKKAAFVTKTKAAACEAGRTVIEGDAAKAVMPYAHARPKGYTPLDEKCWEDPKQRTYRTLVGKATASKSVLIETGDTLVEVLPTKDLAAILEQRGVKVAATTESSGSRNTEILAQKKAKLETAVRRRIHEEIRKHVGRLKIADILPFAAASFFNHSGQETTVRLTRLRSGLDLKLDEIGKHQLSGAEIQAFAADAAAQLLLDLTLIPTTRCHTYHTPDASTLDYFAKLLEIDTKALRAEITIAAAAKKAAKKAAVTAQPSTKAARKAGKKKSRKAA